MKKERAILLKVSAKKDGEVIALPKTLEDICAALEVDTIDIVRRKINGKPYHIICDDEGFLRKNIIASGVYSFGIMAFVGNLIICSGKCTPDGKLIGLSAKDIENVLGCIQKVNDYYVLFNIS